MSVRVTRARSDSIRTSDARRTNAGLAIDKTGALLISDDIDNTVWHERGRSDQRMTTMGAARACSSKRAERWRPKMSAFLTKAEMPIDAKVPSNEPDFRRN
jgi:hypothetical protein